MAELVEESPRTKSIALELQDWPGHRAGQHVDVRLTAVDSVYEAGSEAIGKIRPSLGNDDLATEDGANGSVALVTVWLDTEGRIALSAEEPAGLSASYSRMEVRPLKLDPCAAEDLTHGMTS